MPSKSPTKIGWLSRKSCARSGPKARSRNASAAVWRPRAACLHTHRYGALQAKVVERLGHIDDPKAASLIAIYSHDIPTEFSAAALAQAEAARPVSLGDRTDLRQVPLVTIDGADARDFDDAVW